MIMRHVSGGKGEKEREKKGRRKEGNAKKKCGEGKQTELLWDEKRVRGTATRAGGRGRGRGGERVVLCGVWVCGRKRRGEGISRTTINIDVDWMAGKRDMYSSAGRCK